jgi:hypothetical protein
MWLAVTFEPFHCLAVDIQNLPSSSAGTLEEAILSFSEPETLDEYGTENKAAEKQVSVCVSVLFRRCAYRTCGSQSYPSAPVIKRPPDCTISSSSHFLLPTAL